MTPFISHARNHKPAGGPASSRAACRASMARRHGPFAQHGAAQRYRLHFPRGGRCLWASCGRRFGPGWPCSDPGTHGGPFLSREVESEATRTEVQSVCTSPQTACMPIPEPGGCHPASRRLVGTFGGHAGSGVDGGFTTCQGFNAAFPPFRFILIRMTANVTRRILTAITLAPTATQIAATGALGG